MILQIFLEFLIQVLSTVGVIFLFGLVIALCNRIFYRNLGMFGTPACYITGLIGTPVHELSHALFCVVFGHKIVEIKLYQINSEDGVLGYVRHKYSPNNLYQKIGNFFIGIAPILVISAILYFLAQLLVPGMTDLIIAEAVGLRSDAGFDGLLDCFVFFVECIFGPAQTVYWWIFFIAGLFLAPHMTLSTADIRGAWSGLATMLVLLFGVDVVLGFVSASTMELLTEICLTAGGVLGGLFVFAVAVSLALVVLSLLLRLALRRFV